MTRLIDAADVRLARAQHELEARAVSRRTRRRLMALRPAERIDRLVTDHDWHDLVATDAQAVLESLYRDGMVQGRGQPSWVRRVPSIAAEAPFVVVRRVELVSARWHAWAASPRTPVWSRRLFRALWASAPLAAVAMLTAVAAWSGATGTWPIAGGWILVLTCEAVLTAARIRSWALPIVALGAALSGGVISSAMHVTSWVLLAAAILTPAAAWELRWLRDDERVRETRR